MKNTKKKPKPKVIKELASQLEEELKSSLPIAIQPDGSIVYQNYYIKKMKNGNWGLYSLTTRDFVDQYYLKTCALMAAKAYTRVQLERFFEIKRLDNRYWAHHYDQLIYQQNIKKAKDFDRYLILLNRLEHSEQQANNFREEISRMFKGTFV